jgi:hypothetical protein
VFFVLSVRRLDKKLIFFMVFWFSKLYWLNADIITLRNTILLALANTKNLKEKTHLTAKPPQ